MKKVILTKKLYAEIHKWENLYGVTNTNIIRLLKLYIGMGIDSLITREGKIMCRDFNKAAKILHSRNPKDLIRMAVSSGSFYYGKCDDADMNHYGVMWIASDYLASPETVANLSDSAQYLSHNSEHILDIINNIYTGHADKCPDGESGAAAALEHPHGEHEYSFPGCEQRFYDDGGRACPIPSGAPDRPNASATWSKFLRQWN